LSAREVPEGASHHETAAVPAEVSNSSAPGADRIRCVRAGVPDTVLEAAATLLTRRAGERAQPVGVPEVPYTGRGRAGVGGKWIPGAAVAFFARSACALQSLRAQRVDAGLSSLPHSERSMSTGGQRWVVAGMRRPRSNDRRAGVKVRR
jgi:hypothetical protein